MEQITLASLGWSQSYLAQLDAADLALTPVRIAGVHRTRLDGLSAAGPLALPLTGAQAAGDFAIGDWVLWDGTRIARLLERRTELARRGAGGEVQLIAANVDTLFVVTSCNADFNPARLERYLALAADAGTEAVVLLTKADGCADPEGYRLRAGRLRRGLEVLALDARDPAVTSLLAPWCGRGRTVALVGSSGVGKTTLTNTLAGLAGATAPIREDDARGRHTTTARSLHPLAGGAWLIDTPGMRSLGLADAGDGIDEVFADVAELAAQCRFHDCGHRTEPGCAVLRAVEEGRLDPARVRRWEKLKREDAFHARTPEEHRERQRKFGRMIRKSLALKFSRDGRR